MSDSRVFTKMRHFWEQQVRLHQLYIDRNDVSGGDAIAAMARRRKSHTRGQSLT
jgi:hypothetical protein